MKSWKVVVGQLQTNCYILADEEGRAAVVDPGAEGARILDLIHREELTVEAVVLTHAHFDHMMAAEEVLAATGAKLLAPQEDEATLKNPRRRSPFGADAVPALRPDRLLNDGDTFRVGGMTFRVLHTPGHTPGSCCYVSDGVMLSGDTLFRRDIGRTDLEGGDPAAMRRSLAKLKNLPGDYRVLPGHGPATTLESERQTNPYIQTTSGEA